MFEVQFISHCIKGISYIDSIKIALEGGCRWIQLRMKDASPVELEETAIKAKALCKQYGATFIIDDNVDCALRVKADGVHLGKNDMPIGKARELCGKDFIIGGTANTFEDVVNHYNDGASYIGCGPFRFTTTKKNLSAILGEKGYADIKKLMNENNINIPIVAIGGITVEDIPTIKSVGLDGIALSSYVLTSDNPVDTMKKVIEQASKE